MGPSFPPPGVLYWHGPVAAWTWLRHFSASLLLIFFAALGGAVQTATLGLSGVETPVNVARGPGQAESDEHGRRHVLMQIEKAQLVTQVSPTGQLPGTAVEQASGAEVPQKPPWQVPAGTPNSIRKSPGAVALQLRGLPPWSALARQSQRGSQTKGR